MAKADDVLKEAQPSDQLQIIQESQTFLQECVLGYAKMNVISPADNGHGPTLITNTWNKRPLIQGHVESLATLFKEQGKKPFAQENCLTVGICKSWLQDPKTLSQTAKVLSTVQWSAQALQQEALLFNGQHRLEANLYNIEGTLKATKDLEESLDHCSPDQLADIKTKIARLEEITEAEAYWGVKFLDMGMWHFSFQVDWFLIIFSRYDQLLQAFRVYQARFGQE